MAAGSAKSSWGTTGSTRWAGETSKLSMDHELTSSVGYSDKVLDDSLFRVIEYGSM